MGLKDIVRYDDVETGRLELIVGSVTHCWKVVWLSNLRCNVRGRSCLPYGELPLSIRSNEQWIDCPMLRFNSRICMWLIPLNTSKWTDFGLDMYLCDDGDELAPLSTEDYKQFVECVRSNRVTGISVEPFRQTVSSDYLNHEGGESFDAELSMNLQSLKKMIKKMIEENSLTLQRELLV